MVKHFYKVLKPPYKLHDIPALIGVFLMLLLIPVVTLNLVNIGSQQASAKVLPCPNFGPYGDINGNGSVTTDDVNLAAGKLYDSTYWNADKTKRVDVDGNGQIEFLDIVSINRYVLGYSDQVTFKVCADNDKDGFSNKTEEYLGTDSYRACGTHAWPQDTTNDMTVNTLDLGKFSPYINKSASTQDIKRFDLNRDGIVTISGDIEPFYKPVFNTRCNLSTAAKELVFTANNKSSLSITAGDSLSLAWVSVGTNSPCFTDGWSFKNGVVNTNGTDTTQKPKVSTRYSVTCGGANGSITKTVMVSVASPCPTYIQNGQLYRVSNQAQIYVVENCVKRHVSNEDVMMKCHYRNDRVIVNSTVDGRLPFVSDGPAVTLSTPCPNAPVALCTGDPWVNSISPNPVNPSGSVTLSAKQLRGNCNKYDMVYFHVQNGANYNPPPSCALSNGQGDDGFWCQTTIQAPSAVKDYPIRGCMNAAGTQQCSVQSDGSSPEFVTLKVQTQSSGPGPKDPAYLNDPPFDNPLNCTLYVSGYNYGSGHYAKDLGCSSGGTSGREIRSSSPGTVIAAGWEGGCGYQVRVRVYATNGDKYVIRYCHMSGMNVGYGQNVSRGTVLGWVGCTGTCSGPHLHLVTQKNSVYDQGSQYGGDGHINPNVIINGVP